MDVVIAVTLQMWIRNELQCAPPTIQEGAIIMDFILPKLSFLPSDIKNTKSDTKVLEILEFLIPADNQFVDVSHHYFNIVQHRLEIQALYKLWHCCMLNLHGDDKEHLESSLSYRIKNMIGQNSHPTRY